MKRLGQALAGRVALRVLLALTVLASVGLYVGRMLRRDDGAALAGRHRADPGPARSAADLGYRPVRPPAPAPASTGARSAESQAPRERALQVQAERDDARRRELVLGGMAGYADGLAQRALLIEARRRAGLEVLP